MTKGMSTPMQQKSLYLYDMAIFCYQIDDYMYTGIHIDKTYFLRYYRYTP